MPRPADWSALGLTSDPTPGDPDRIDRIIAAELVYINLATTIDNGLTEIKNSSSEIFVGKTADALRGVIDGNLRTYISTYKGAHEKVRGALTTYVGVMREQQRKADAALTAAQGLASDDEAGRATHKTTADNARSAMEAASTAAEAIIDEAAEAIASPLDDCEEFWKALSWLAVALVIPAILVGGPLALFAIALNVALLIKTAIDFANGKANLTQLILAVLGVIAPTTKGLHLGNLWSAIKAISTRGWQGTRNLFLGGANSFGLFVRTGLGVDNITAATGAWIRGSLGGFRIGPIGTAFSGIGKFGFSANTFKLFALGADMAVISNMGARTFFALRSLAGGLNGIKGLGTAVAHGLSGWKSLRLFLPVAADEMKLGVGLAFRIGFVDRGIFGMYRYGAFVNGQFLGAGSKISGGVGAGFGAFAPGSDLINLGHVNMGGLHNPMSGPLGQGFNIPPMGSQVGNIFGDFQNFSIPPLGSFNAAFNMGNFPPLGTHLNNGGNMGAIVPFNAPAAKFADIPGFSFSNLGMTNFGNNFAFQNAFNTGFGNLGGLGSTTPALGHVSIGSIDAMAQALPKVDINLSTTGGALANDLASPGTVGVVKVENVQGAAMPQLGSLATPHLTPGNMPQVGVNAQTAPVAGLNGNVTPSTLGHTIGINGAGLNGLQLPSIDARLADMPSINTTFLSNSPTMDLSAGAVVNVPNINTGPLSTHVATPDLGTLPGATQTNVPSSAGAAPGQVNTPNLGTTAATVNLSALPVRADTPNLGTGTQSPTVNTPNITGLQQSGPGTGTVDAPSTPGPGEHPPTGLGEQNLQVSNLNGGTHVDVSGSQVAFGGGAPPHVISPAVGNLPGGPSGLGGTGGFGSPGSSLAVPGPSAFQRNLQIYMIHSIQLDFQHSFRNIPGLQGVTVNVNPSLQTGHSVDVDVNAPGRTDITAQHVTNGNQQVLQIDQALTNGGVQRWEYELSAANNYQLLSGPTVVPQVAAPAGAVARGAASPPVVQVQNIPGLTGQQIRVVTIDGNITNVQLLGGPPLHPNMNVSHHLGADGHPVARIEQTLSNVETRVWEFDAHGGNLQHINVERHITLQGGPHTNEIIAFRVDPANNPAGGPVWHFGANNTPAATATGNLTVTPHGIHIPNANGFTLYDPATGQPTHTAVQLTGGNQGGVAGGNLHVVMPNAGGAPRLTDPQGNGNFGAVTIPANGNGVYHVLPNNTGTNLQVFGVNGQFSHTALDVRGVPNVPGGYVRDPATNPHLTDPDGAAVNVPTTVTGITGNGFRMEFPGGHITVNGNGVHTNNVVALTNNGAATGHYVFTPVNAGPSPVRTIHDAGGANPPGVILTPVGNSLHVNPGPAGNHIVDVHGANGAFSHRALPLTSGGAPGGFIRLPDGAGGAPRLANGDGVINLTGNVTPLNAGGYVIAHPGGRIVVDGAGAHTHNVTPLQGLGGPTGLQATTPIPSPHAANPNPDVHPIDGFGAVDNTFTVTRANNEIRLTQANGSFSAHGLDGAHRFDATRIQGGPFGGHFVQADATGSRLVDARFQVPRNSTVVDQTGLGGSGFRVERGAAGHVVVDPMGVHRFDVIPLRGQDGARTGEFVFTGIHQPTNPGPLGLMPNTHAADGAPHPGNPGVTGRPGGGFQVTDNTSIRLYNADGTFDHQAVRLFDGNGVHLNENVLVNPGGLHQLVDGNLAHIPGTVARPNVGGGFNITDTTGGFRVFDGGGALRFTATPVQIPHGTGTFPALNVADHAGVHQFQVIRTSDAQINNPGQAQLIEITPGGLQLRDGNLNVLSHAVTPTPTGGYQIAGIGGQATEFRRFDVTGRLEAQRINIVGGNGQLNANRWFEIDYPATGTPTWRLNQVGPNGAPIAGPSTPRWFEGGTVDMAGAGAGRVHLTSPSGITVFERRNLPGVGSLDAHHSTTSLGEFSIANQRGTWVEFNANGNIVQHGTRHWGESTRSYYDVRSFAGGASHIRVRHFQISFDGGHVLSDVNRSPLTQTGVSAAPWVRFDKDFQPIAHGTRNFGPGRGFTDHMNHPITGQPVLVQEKFGRFQTNLHDVRRYHQIELTPDGMPKPDFVSRHPDGNINGFGKTLQNGDFLNYKRFAEQRPPVWFREAFNTEMRLTDNAQWLNDSTMRVGTFTQTPAGGGPNITGVQFVANNKATFDVSRGGTIVRETRTLLNGRPLTVGDVAMPTNTATGIQVNPHAGYLPWSDGAFNGHRSFNAADFPAGGIPGQGTRNITWVDRHNTAPHNGDWFSPNAAGANWHIVRVGFDDGTYVDFRPPPQLGGTANNLGHLANGNWTRYSPHGVVHGRSDTFPNPNGGGVIHVEGVMGRGTEHFTWRDGNGNTGLRETSFHRQIHFMQFDRESFRDFDAAGQLIREQRQLGGGMSLQAWRTINAQGQHVWHWNKMDAHGNILDFGGGVDNRMRFWFDRNGTLLSQWAPGARFSDSFVTPNGTHRLAQEIPAPPQLGPVRGPLTDDPFRVRDYMPDVNTNFNPHVWQESDQGILSHIKTQLPDGTYLETNAFNKHGRQYDVTGVNPINDRAISGYISRFNANGSMTIVGRESHFTGIANEYRGLNRTWREVNRWEFGPSVNGSAVPTTFLGRAIQSTSIDMFHEFVVDFAASIVVTALIRLFTGTAFTVTDVTRALFGAGMAALSKGLVATGHNIANRGGWKVWWSNIDYGQPGTWRPNDDSWNTEWGATERPTRWRGGTYEFTLGLGVGMLTGFTTGSLQAVIFGIRAADGSLVQVVGTGALLGGAANLLGGFIDSISVGAGRALIQHTMGSRLIHRQGPADIYIIGGLGKIFDKLLSQAFLGPAAVRWLNAAPPPPDAGPPAVAGTTGSIGDAGTISARNIPPLPTNLGGSGSTGSLDLGGLNLRGTGSGSGGGSGTPVPRPTGTGSVGGFPRTYQVFMLHGIQLDFQHAFGNIPGLPNVRVDVNPSLRHGHSVEININAPGRTDITAQHVTNGNQQVLQIDQALANGGVQRWEFELSAANNYRLLSGPVMVAPPAPAAPAHGPSAAPLQAAIPTLGGRQVEVHMSPDGQSITHVGPAGGANAGNLTFSHHMGADGHPIVRIEQAVSHVEMRRWEFDAHGGNLQHLTMERHITLQSGPHHQTVVAWQVGAAGAPVLNGPVWHLTSANGPVHGTTGPPTVHGDALHVPNASGFDRYNTTTGQLTHTGLQLHNPAPTGMHILTPVGGTPDNVLVNAGATGNLGTVTVPAGGNGVFHVTPAGAGPAVRVYHTAGIFSHETLPIRLNTVTGGHIHSPTGPNPQLAHADGQLVPGSNVTGLNGGGFRVDDGTSHITVDANGVHTHNVLTLTNSGAPTGHYVFTPANAGPSPVRTIHDAGGANPPGVTVTPAGTSLHVNPGPAGNHIVDVYRADGAFAHRALPLTGGGAPGGFIRLPDPAGGVPRLADADGFANPAASVTPLTTGGFLITHPGGRIVVDNAGAHTHNVIPLQGLGGPTGLQMLNPVPTPHAANPNPEVHPVDGFGAVDNTFTVTRANNEIRLTQANGSFSAHGLDGAHRFDATHIQGGPFGGHFIRSDIHGSQLVDHRFTVTRNSTVVDQTGRASGGFRVERGAAGHVVIDHPGVHRFDVIPLRAQDGSHTGEFVFTGIHQPTNPGPVGLMPNTHAADGAPHPGGGTVVNRAGGGFQVTDNTSIRLYNADGTFDHQAIRLLNGAGAHLNENVLVHPGGLHQLVDANLTPVAGAVARPNVTGSFNITDGTGGFRVFVAGGSLRFTAAPVQVPHPHGGAPVQALSVTDHAGVHQFHAIRLSDGNINSTGQAQLLQIDGGPPRLRDGNLNPLNNTIAMRPGNAGYQIHGVGQQATEFRQFNWAGSLEFQRIDIVGGNGRRNAGRWFEITYPAGGGTAVWRLEHVGPGGAPVAGPSTPRWFEGGTVDMAGSGAGRVHLTSHSGTTVFERRLLPGNGVLDAHHSTTSLGEYSMRNQRGTWAEFNANGNLVQHGTRHWGESTRSYYDIRPFAGGTSHIRVRHFQLSQDGGHVLADVNSSPATQNRVDTGPWVRYDKDFRPIAHGTRNIGPGRGWTDHMNHPVTGARVLVQEKFGRFQSNLHDVRRYHQIELTADGMPKPDFVSRHPDGNINGSGRTLPNGDFLVFKRFAEQRPPVWFRRLFNADIRHTNLAGLQWLNDSRFRVGSFTQTAPGAGPNLTGTHFIANNKATFDVTRAGQIVRERRPLPNGRTLTVGDVAMPTNTNTGQPVLSQNHYLPWSDGTFHGHRSTDPGDFPANVPGQGTRTIAWVDRYTPNAPHGDWYTPTAGGNWQIVRTGFTDGTYIDFRPPPQLGGTAHNIGHTANGDWTRYDPHGTVFGRSDTFPNPNGGGVIRVEGVMGANTREFRWTDSNGNSGTRLTSFERQITPWQWDRESYRDLDANGQLLREHRQLGGGMSLVAWRTVDAQGRHVWHWNKLDAYGNVLDFGGNVANRMRFWFDRHGNLLPQWAPGARFSDSFVTPNGTHQLVQEIPAPPALGRIRGPLTDDPFRVRDYMPDVNTTYNPHVWQDSDQGILAHVKKQLPDGTYLETDAFNKHARRYAADGTTPVHNLAISGFVSDITPDGSMTVVGRESHYTGANHEYRGLTRMWREVNRWEWGPSAEGAAVPTTFIGRAFQSMTIEMVTEFMLDFVTGLAVTAFVKLITQSAFTSDDVLRVLYGAALSALSKGLVSGAHHAANRGGWKVWWSNIDYGMPGPWRPNDDSMRTEWHANERPVRWRGGTYEFVLGLGTGAATGFVTSASQAALFGVRAADGSLVKLVGRDALRAGGLGVLAGFLDGISVGTLKALIQHFMGSRLIHRQGPADIFLVGGIGKVLDKMMSQLVLGPAAIAWAKATPSAPLPPLPPPPGTSGGSS